MKRQDIIAKLMNEGFTQKTLVNMTDKQLSLLSERLLSEQVYGTATPSSPVPGTTYVPKEKAGEAMKTRQTFKVYESDVNEEKGKGEKNSVMKRINHKIETKIKNNQCIKTEIELLKRMGETVPEKAQKYYNEKMGKKKEKVFEPVEQTIKPISNVPIVDGSNEKIKTWVNKIVENKFLTSKNDIINLVQKKINEQESDVADTDVDTSTLPDFLTYDAITAAGGQPATKPTTKPGTKPTTKPGTRPTPKTPFQPGPGPKHNPKASMEEED